MRFYRTLVLGLRLVWLIVLTSLVILSMAGNFGHELHESCIRDARLEAVYSTGDIDR